MTISWTGFAKGNISAAIENDGYRADFGVHCHAVLCHLVTGRIR